MTNWVEPGWVEPDWVQQAVGGGGVRSIVLMIEPQGKTLERRTEKRGFEPQALATAEIKPK